MEKPLSRSEAWGLEDAGIRFAQARGDCEYAFAFAMLTNPGLGIIVARGKGIDEGFFQVHYDARLIFCACDVAAHLGEELVWRLARRALREDNYELADSLDRRVKATGLTGESDFLRSMALVLSADRLCRMNKAERDSREHLEHACGLLNRAVA